MKCIDVKEKLDAFSDGEIDSAESEKIEIHLEDCIGCKAELENFQSLGKALRQNLYVSAPISLDEKVLADFRNFHGRKRTEKTENKKMLWFGIPRFAFAAALFLFVAAIFSAFQIGRMSVGERNVAASPIRQNNDLLQAKNDEKKQSEESNPAPVKIVEVPVIKEKIVKVEVIKTRTIYVNKNEKNEIPRTVSADNNLALKSSVENNGYLTKTDLRDFQPVSEIKFKINKEEK